MGEGVATAEEPKLNGGLRAAAAIATLVLLFGVAVMVMVVINPDNLPICDDVESGKAALGPTLECFDASRTSYNVSRVTAGIAGVLGALAALLGIYVASTGKRGTLMARLTVAALLFGGLTVLIG